MYGKRAGYDKFRWKYYLSDLPPNKKDEALFQYKYTFNAENNSIPGYFTEKLIDGIIQLSSDIFMLTKKYLVFQIFFVRNL